MLFLKIVASVFVLISIVGGIEQYKEQLQLRREAARKKAEQEKREADGQDWRKVGVVNSYRNRGMMEVAYAHICPVCKEKQYIDIGDGNGIHRFLCPTCEKRFEQDKTDGVFPPGVSRVSRNYDFMDYYALRLIEYELRTGAIDKAEAIAMQESVIQTINDADIQAEEHAQRRVEMPDTSYRNDYLN